MSPRRAASQEAQSAGSVRLDKWLWAARFFKTRSLAKQAIESGHVRLAGDRTKVSREVMPGLLLSVRQGWDEVEVVVLDVSDERRGAPEARWLYQETAESQKRRETLALQRKASAVLSGPDRPTKKERRDIVRFKRSWSG